MRHRSARRFSARRFSAFAALAGALIGATLSASAQERVLNLYSARHYQTDEAL